MSPLGFLFQNQLSEKSTQSASHNKLRQPVPGYPESAANKLAQVWNAMNLSNAKSLGQAKSLAHQWYKNSEITL